MSSETAFRAIADPTRRAILDRLARDEAAVGDLVELFDMSQPAISQHLKVLRDAGLVEARKDGRRKIYRLTPDALRAVFEWVESYRRFWTERLDALGELLDNEADNG